MDKHLRILGLIPARGGSKGVPRKNIRLLRGLPLISYSIREALLSKLLTDIVVSTDDEEIRRVALDAGAEAPFLRPAELATDTALAIPVIQHAIKEMEAKKNYTYDYLALLQPTSPLRTHDDIDACLNKLIQSEADGIVTLVSVDNWHPMKMKKIINNLVTAYEQPPIEGAPRQSLPPVYMVNGVLYGARRDVVMKEGSLSGKNCLPFIMPAERSVNIDTETDFVLADYFLRQKEEQGRG